MILELNWEEKSIKEAERPRLAALLRKGMETALKLAGGPENGEIGLTLVDNSRIHELNRDYRGKDYPTDVISFALMDESDEEPEITAGEADYEDTMLGDILISTEKAREQAGEYGHSFERELVYLAVHGTLHLLGFDHEGEEERRLMRAKEEEVMARLGLIR